MSHWQDPLLFSKGQILISGSVTLIMANKAIRDADPVAAATSLYNAYLCIKGIHNHRITARSAKAEPLRALWDERPPANDNLITPSQSLSNTSTLVSRFMAANVAGIFALNGYEAVTKEVPHPAALAFWGVVAAGNGALARVLSNAAKQHGPTRMPSITGKLKL